MLKEKLETWYLDALMEDNLKEKQCKHKFP